MVYVGEKRFDNFFFLFFEKIAEISESRNLVSLVATEVLPKCYQREAFGPKGLRDLSDTSCYQNLKKRYQALSPLR